MAPSSSVTAPPLLLSVFFSWSLPWHGGWDGKRGSSTSAQVRSEGSNYVEKCPVNQENMSQESCACKTGSRASNAKAMEKVGSS